MSKRNKSEPRLDQAFCAESLKDLSGYIAEHLREDVDVLLPAERKRQKPRRSAASVAKRIAVLPEAAAESARAFDVAAREGVFPEVMELESYGFDFKNCLEGAPKGRYFGITHDAGGNIFALDLTTGEVRLYNHETDEFEQETKFVSLDVFTYAWLRSTAASLHDVKRVDLQKSLRLVGKGAEWLIEEAGLE